MSRTVTTIPTRSGLVVVPNAETPADRSIEKRRLRKHFLLNVIRLNGPISRADISKVSGYNLPSVSSLVDELVGDKLVWEESARAIPRGRRPVPVQLNSRAASVLGIDIGWSSTVGILLDLGGNQISQFEARTPKFKTAGDYIGWLHEVIGRLMETSTIPPPPVCGIGIAVPGLVPREEPETRIIIETPVKEIRRSLTEEFKIPVLIDNDARMMALGSLWFGEGKKYRSFAVLNVGYGLGLGVIMNGKLLKGSRGFAAEIGHIPLGDPAAPCSCGQVGCLQTVASGIGLARMAREGGLPVENVEDLVSMVRKGNPKAREILDRFSDALARGIATIFSLYDPAAVVVSGRVTRSADLFFDDVISQVGGHTLPAIIEPSRIVLSSLDVRLGPLGAAAAILHHIFYSSHVEVEKVI